MIKPVHGHYEQLSNAIALKKLGCGSITREFDNNRLTHWLKKYPIEAACYPNVALEVARWISEDPSLSVEILSEYLWSKTLKPPMQLNYLAV